MKRHAFVVGAFVIGALILAVAAIFWLSGGSLFRQQLHAMIHFEGGVAGLYVGAPVTFRGVQVGQVESIGIEVDPTTLAARIPARIRLVERAVRFSHGGVTEQKPPVELPELIQRGLRAKLVAQSFVTGQKSIELDFVADAAPPPLPTAGEDPEIPVVADRFDALFDQVADLPVKDTVAELRDTLQSLKRMLASTQVTLDGVGKEVADTAVAARKTLGVASTSLTQVVKTLQDVQRSADASLGSVTRLADSTRDTVQSLQPDLQRTLANAREAAESARLATGRVAELTAPGAPLRADLDAAMRDLSQSARGLREWTELLEEQPNAAIFGRARR